ncbi:uncharacterized protein [Typha latifolia]|uniref:uncharacterized protein n=1 Tax=Typha latifolia TaxID=4733 RepID=UPI003C2C9AF5
MKDLLPLIVGPEGWSKWPSVPVEVFRTTLSWPRNRTLDAHTKSEPPLLMLKLDIEKAFDRINWAAVLQTLSSMGFLERWCNWIKACSFSEEKEAICNSLGLRPAYMPFNYLGVQILGQRIKVREHNRLVNCVEKKLVGWKSGVLSMASRPMLINATMLLIPTYWMCSTWLPDLIFEAITKKARAFLWDNGSGHGILLISWDTATCPKEEGGMAIRKLKLARTALSSGSRSSKC